MTTAGEASDARLVQRVLDGDRAAFGEVYERYADRLFDFAVGMLRDRDDAADAVADSFVTMAEKLGQLRDPDRLRPWLYAVVRRECLRRLQARTKVAYGDDDRLGAIPDPAPSPAEQAEASALRELVWAAAEGLGERDRSLLDLHLRHGLEGQELADAMGITAGNAYTSLNRLKAQLERSLGALLVARRGSADCRELGVVLDGWDGTFSVLMRKRVARHVDQCLVCERQRAALAPLGVAAGIPFLSAPDELRERVLGDLRLVGHETGHDTGPGAPGAGGPGGPGAGGPAPGDPDVVRRRRIARALSATAVVLVVAALVVIAVLDRPATTPLAGRDAAVSPTPSPAATPAPQPAAQDTEGAVTLAPAPTSAAPSADATTSTAPTAAPTTTPTAGPTTAPPTGPTGPATPTTTAPVPGRVVVTPSLLDLGEQARAGTVTLTNPGDLPVDWTMTSAQPWVLVPQSGSTAAQESAPVTVVVNRRALPPGTSDAVVTVSWAGGSTSFTVRATQPSGPARLTNL